MIHEVESWMLDLDLSEFDIFTFDDGLYSQFKYYNHFLKYNKPMYFFISTNIICDEDELSQKEQISCKEAHRKYFAYKDTSSYMKWNQIQQIYKTENCFIGGHSHNHPKLKGLSLLEQFNISKDEARNMLDTFKNKNITIDSFCYPYNDEILGYNSILKEMKFFGSERIAIEGLK